jgi:hypothetical protein
MQDRPDEILAEIGLLGLADLDHFGYVSTLTELHDDKDLALGFVYDPIVVLDDGWVPQFPKDIDFTDQHLLLLIRHLAVVKLFPDQDPSVALPLDLGDGAKGALADVAYAIVLVH